MIIACVTSRYLPNLRYLARLLEVDHAVLLDLASLPHQNKNSFVSRNRICDRNGRIIWLSVPVRRKGTRYISQTLVEQTCHNWIDKHIKSIAHAYPYHKNVSGGFLEQLHDVLQKSNGSLIDINMRSLRLILDVLGFTSLEVIKQSEIINTHTDQHRLEISRALGGTYYIAGQVEWDLMLRNGTAQTMESSDIRVRRSPDLDQNIFSTEIVRELSCVHSICTLGPERTRAIIEEMIKHLDYRAHL